MTPTERYAQLVEFWDVRVQRAETEGDREYFQWEAALAWFLMEFYEKRPKAGYDLINGKICNRRVGDGVR